MKVVVASSARTPFTRAHKGELKNVRPDAMAAHVIRQSIARVSGLQPGDVRDVILGCAMPEAEQGMNVARIASALAGLSDAVPGMTVNRFCASGLQSMAQAAQAIHCGQYDVAVAGGTETMTMVPMGGHKISSNPELMDACPQIYMTMGATAEKVAARFHVSREEQDGFAYKSQRLAAQAQAAGRFQDEISPLTAVFFDEKGSQRQVVVSADTALRVDTQLHVLEKLKPAFDVRGTVTAGNASPLTDGAAAAVLMSEAKAMALNLKPLGYFIDYVVTGVPPDIMGIGPVSAVRKLLERNKLQVQDIDVFELNEAFAAQAVYCIRELGIPADRVNPNGGAIALGHPLGASGTRMAGTILRELNRHQGKYGIVTMCVGGGMGAAALFESEW